MKSKPNSTISPSRGALVFAARACSLDGCKDLLHRGVSVDDTEPLDKRTALHAAAASGNIPLCALLLEAGADPNALDAHGMAPILGAIQRKHEPVALMLTQWGAELRPFTGLRHSALKSALVWNLESMAWRLSEAAIQRSNARSIRGETAPRTQLHAHDERFDVSLLRHLLACACRTGRSKTIQWCLTHLTHLTCSNGLGADHGLLSDMLLLACKSGHAPAAAVLLRHGADPHQVDGRGRNLVHHAAAEGRVRLIRLLSSRQVVCDLADAKGTTPLHLAAMKSHLAACTCLVLEMGAALSPADSKGRTPMQLVNPAFQAPVVELLSGVLPAALAARAIDQMLDVTMPGT